MQHRSTGFQRLASPSRLAWAGLLSLIAHVGAASLASTWHRPDAPPSAESSKVIQARLQAATEPVEPKPRVESPPRDPRRSQPPSAVAQSIEMPARQRRQVQQSPMLTRHAEQASVAVASATPAKPRENEIAASRISAAPPTNETAVSPAPVVRERAAETAPVVAAIDRGERHREVAYKHNPAPPYPAPARRLGIEGTVQLRVLVGANGRATQVEVAQSSGAALLDEAAAQAVKEWAFIPALDDYAPIAHWVEIPVRFRLAR